MKMKFMLNSIFRIALCLIFFGNVRAQVATKDTLSTTKDTVSPKTIPFGLRVGIDAFKLSRSSFDANYKGIELVGDFPVTRKHYVAVELGNEKKTVQEDHLNFTTKGSYIRVGFDFNGYENWTGMNNQIYVGLRYGLSTFSQTLNSYSIYYPNSYFPTPVLSKNIEFNGLTAHWTEVVAGVKAALFRNLYLGFSFRLNYLLSQSKLSAPAESPNTFESLYIPGFNRTYDGKFGVGFNYTISYTLPLFKVKVKDPKQVEAEKISKQEAKMKKQMEREQKKLTKKKN